MDQSVAGETEIHRELQLQLNASYQDVSAVQMDFHIVVEPVSRVEARCMVQRAKVGMLWLLTKDQLEDIH